MIISQGIIFFILDSRDSNFDYDTVIFVIHSKLILLRVIIVRNITRINNKHMRSGRKGFSYKYIFILAGTRVSLKWCQEILKHLKKLFI